MLRYRFLAGQAEQTWQRRQSISAIGIRADINGPTSGRKRTPAKAPAKINLNGVQRGPVDRNALAKLDALARRHPQQVGGAPDDVALKLVCAIINVNDLPHHFNNLLAALAV